MPFIAKKHVRSENESTSPTKTFRKEPSPQQQSSYQRVYKPLITQDDEIGKLLFKLNELATLQKSDMFRIQLVIDNREMRNKLFVGYIDVLHESYKQFMHMRTGDFSFNINGKSLRLGERKSFADLCASTCSGHMKHQQTEMNILLPEFNGKRDRIFFLYEKSYRHDEQDETKQQHQTIVPTDDDFLNGGGENLNSRSASYNCQILDRGRIMSTMVHRFIDGYGIFITENGAHTAAVFLKALLYMIEEAQNLWNYYNLSEQPDFSNEAITGNEATLSGPDLVEHMHTQEATTKVIKIESFPLSMTKAQRDLVMYLNTIQSMTAPYSMMIAQDYECEGKFFKFIWKNRHNPQIIVDKYAQSIPSPDLSRGKELKRMGGARIMKIVNRICGTEYKTKVTGGAKNKRDVVILPEQWKQKEEKKRSKKQSKNEDEKEESDADEDE